MNSIFKGVFMKFKPLHDRVLIEVLDSSEKTAGGIIIPDTAQEKPQEGKLLQLVVELKLKMEKSFQWMSKLETKYYLVNGQAPKLKLVEKNIVL